MSTNLKNALEAISNFPIFNRASYLESIAKGKITITLSSHSGKYKIFKQQLETNGTVKCSEFIGFIDVNTSKFGKPFLIYSAADHKHKTVESVEEGIQTVLTDLTKSDGILPIHTRTNNRTFWIIYYG